MVAVGWAGDLAKQQLGRRLRECNMLYIHSLLARSLFVARKLHVVSNFCVMLVGLGMFGFLFFFNHVLYLVFTRTRCQRWVIICCCQVYFF